MTNLDDEARVILDLARDTHDPNDQDRARVRAALASQLGAAAGLGLAAGVGVGVAAKAAAATGAGVAAKASGAGAMAAQALGAGAATAKAVGAGAVATKLIGAVVLVSATVGVGATAIRHARHTAVAPVAVSERSTTHRRQHALPPAHAPSPSLAAPAGTPNEEESSPPPPAPPATVVPAERPAVAETTQAARAPARADAHKHSSPAVAAPLASVTKATRQHESDATDIRPSRMPLAVADEARLVQAALGAIRSGQHERALALFDEHAFRYPLGALAQERDGKRALVLVELGRTADARAAIHRFLLTYPSSPLAPRLRDRLRDLDRP